MKTIKIGNQEWTAENLAVTHYRNGDPIEGQIFNPAHPELGGYYTFDQITDPRGFAPEGFHIPTDEEWQEFVDHLVGDNIAGTKLKSKEFGGTNESGFNVLGAGYRGHNGGFYDLADYADFWSSSQYSSTYGIYRFLYYGGASIIRSYANKTYGFSVRCVKDKI